VRMSNDSVNASPVLEMLEVDSPTRWRWKLSDDEGNILVDLQIDFNASAWEFEAFKDLAYYLDAFRSADQPMEEEQAAVRDVGAWVGSTLLGAVGERIVALRQSVLLVLPSEVEHRSEVAGWPWELALVGGQSLAEIGVNFVLCERLEVEPLTKTRGDALRMLAVFSSPQGPDALDLRRERVALVRQVTEIAVSQQRAVELQVLQYGVTRAVLEGTLSSPDGWDILHISGHGAAGLLILEDEGGHVDEVKAIELVQLIERAKARLKLVTLFACESATQIAEENLYLLGFSETPPSRASRSQSSGSSTSLAAALSERVQCVVLAMRFSVGDEFAIGLSHDFYELAIGDSQRVSRALGLALARASTRQRSFQDSALSLGIPVLYGAAATRLVLEAPTGGQDPLLQDGQATVGQTPPEPPLFVGRTGPMARARAALRPGSGFAGVVYYGMAGAGKSTCATELAHMQRRGFSNLCWYQASSDQAAPTAELVRFALTLEDQLPGLQLIDAIDDSEGFRGAADQLNAYLEEHEVLVVLDNLEVLLTPDGEWRDGRWDTLISAFSSHTGASRAVLTTRELPENLTAQYLFEPIYALTLQESVLLAAALPSLGKMLDDAHLSTDVAVTGADLVGRVLSVLQGHPKLIELADGLATDPETLKRHLDDAERVWNERGASLKAFVAGNESDSPESHYLAVLEAWTSRAVSELSNSSRLALQLLANLEVEHRTPSIVGATWSDVWAVAPMQVDESAITNALQPPMEHALVEPVLNDTGTELVSYRIHPVIAEIVVAETPEVTMATIQGVLGKYWFTLLEEALLHEEQSLSSHAAQYARAALPYLLRDRRWPEVDRAAESLLNRERTPAVANYVTPFLEAAAAGVNGSDDQPLVVGVNRTLARAVAITDLDQAARRLQSLIQIPVRAKNYELAYGLAGDLAAYYMDLQRFDLALGFANQHREYVRRAGRGHWTQLLAEATWLQARRVQGGHDQEVLDRGAELVTILRKLPEKVGPEDHTVTPYNVLETLFGTMAASAQELKLWQTSLDLNAEVVASLQRRGATRGDVALDLFNDWIPMANLGHVQEARDLVVKCRLIFEEEEHPLLLRATYALAQLEKGLGHQARAQAWVDEFKRLSKARELRGH
jgi:hypothetical protein